jgi:hypothetical protein
MKPVKTGVKVGYMGKDVKRVILAEHQQQY